MSGYQHPRYNVTHFITMEVHVDKQGSNPTIIALPAVPRVGEIITLDDHYKVKKVCWQPHLGVIEPPQGYSWPDSTYYTLRLIVRKAYNDLVDGLNKGAHESDGVR